jgi:hypothetical protein
MHGRPEESLQGPRTLDRAGTNLTKSRLKIAAKPSTAKHRHLARKAAPETPIDVVDHSDSPSYSHFRSTTSSPGKEFVRLLVGWEADRHSISPFKDFFFRRPL